MNGGNQRGRQFRQGGADRYDRKSDHSFADVPVSGDLYSVNDHQFGAADHYGYSYRRHDEAEEKVLPRSREIRDFFAFRLRTEDAPENVRQHRGRHYYAVGAVYVFRQKSKAQKHYAEKKREDLPEAGFFREDDWVYQSGQAEDQNNVGNVAANDIADRQAGSIDLSDD